MEEIWKNVVGYEGLYEVSNYGNVKSVFRSTTFTNKFGTNVVRRENEKKMKPQTIGHGYLCVVLSKNTVKTTHYIHRLVAEAFIPNIENKPTVDHINGDKTMNVVWNLRWATNYEQTHNSYTFEKYEKTHKIPIVQYDLEGNYVREFDSTAQAAIIYGSKKLIRNCLKHRINSAYGYKWEYKEKGGA